MATFSKYLGKRAEQVKPGTCVICLCTDLVGCAGGCSWEEGTDDRLCTAHGHVEKLQARNALAAAGRQRR